jgi:YHS domain-containing protein
MSCVESSREGATPIDGYFSRDNCNERFRKIRSSYVRQRTDHTARTLLSIRDGAWIIVTRLQAAYVPRDKTSLRPR